MQKGEPWGAEGVVPDDVVVVGSDAEARVTLEAARRERRPMPPLGLLGGDLCRTVGGRGDPGRLRAGASATLLRCDLGEALVDGRVRLFVAHVVVRGRSLWRGPVTAVMNAQYVGRRDVAPRAHPGDGLLDLVEVDGSMSLGDRWKAWRRLPSGTHVPHPRIAARRAAAVQLDVSGRRVVIDGEAQPAAHALSLRIDPGALTVVV
jgi:hypothetical protein